jgi:Zinc finger, C3HC4 type (RING finger)
MEVTKEPCPICHEGIDETVVKCVNGHEFCRDCSFSWLDECKTTETCPLCRQELHDPDDAAHGLPIAQVVYHIYPCDQSEFLMLEAEDNHQADCIVTIGLLRCSDVTESKGSYKAAKPVITLAPDATTFSPKRSKNGHFTVMLNCRVRSNHTASNGALWPPPKDGKPAFKLGHEYEIRRHDIDKQIYANPQPMTGQYAVPEVTQYAVHDQGEHIGWMQTTRQELVTAIARVAGTILWSQPDFAGISEKTLTPKEDSGSKDGDKNGRNDGNKKRGITQYHVWRVKNIPPEGSPRPSMARKRPYSAISS